MKVSLHTHSTNLTIRNITMFAILFPNTKSLIFYPMSSKDILNIKILVIVLITISKKQALSTTCIVKQTIVIAYYTLQAFIPSQQATVTKGQQSKVNLTNHRFGVYLSYHVIKLYRSLLRKTLNISAHSAWIIVDLTALQKYILFFYWYFYQNN